MLQRLKLPHTLQWVVRLFIMYLVIFTLFRAAAYIAFNPDKNVLHGEEPSQYSTVNVLPAFLLGLLYDLRWISLMLAPIVVASCIPAWTPFKNRRNKRLWSAYLVVVTFMMLFFFGADFGHFEYVRTRLNASALNFFEDARISLRMLWESYPIFWIVFALTLVILLLAWIINRSYFRVEEKNNDRSKFDYQRRWYLVTLLLMAFFVHGGFSMKPLSTHDSFRRMNDEFRGFLSLNPFQNFFTSLKFRNPGFKGNQVNEEVRKARYPLLASILQPDSASLADTTYARFISGRDSGVRPNVVLVLCESFSMYKSSMCGNPLNPTPFIKSLCDSGLFFNRCFTPHFGTARGVFALLSGIPDVQMSKFSSRNKQAVHQHTIINNFNGYEKFYFIGGSTEFNNFRGLIANISNVKLYEEGSYKSKNYNVWGISDKNLMIEAAGVLNNQSKPFFAVIQTADNHEPYTIPEEDSAYVRRQFEKDTVKRYGFKSLPEFHAIGYMDYCIEKLITEARRQPWFSNTIFVFIGDHGVIGDARSCYPGAWTSHRLTEEHVPLVFYAPGLLRPAVHNEPVSQIDVLPTLAGLAGVPYKNTTLGRDLLAPGKTGHFAFTIFHDAGKTGIVSDSFYYIHNYNTGDDELLPLYGDAEIPRALRRRQIEKYAPLAEGMYETAKWMLIHNQPGKNP